MTDMDAALKMKAAGDFAMRSCWNCNPAHEHLKNDDPAFLFVCFDCGHWFYRGADLTTQEATE